VSARRSFVVAAAAAVTVLSAALAVAQEVRIEARHVKVGQRYRFKLTAQNTRVWEVVAKTDDEVTYRIRQTVAGKEELGEPVTCALKRKAAPEDAKKKKVADETLEVSGVKFPCAVYETETGGMTVKTWVSLTFPELVKQQMGKDVTQELVEIQ
jgi:hypothetical protein